MKSLKDLLLISKVSWAGKTIHTLMADEKDAGELDFGVSQDPSFESLKENIMSLNNQKKMKVVMFTAPSSGNGVTTAVFNFSKSLSQNSKLKVLLLDANLRKPDCRLDVGEECHQGRFSLGPANTEVRFVVKKPGPENLWILQFKNQNLPPLSILKSKSFRIFLERVRGVFDFVVLDTPAINKYADSQLLCRMTDGVILLVEAGKTRRQVAIKAKQCLEQAGANILGVVLNKRKYFIPDFIYSRM